MYLRTVAIAGGFILLGSAYVVKKTAQRIFRESEYYEKSLNLLEGYHYGVDILGKPIKVFNVDIWNYNMNWVDGLNARVAIPLRGVKEKGTLHSWASREKPGDSWDVDKLDLEVKQHQWTFYINPKSKDKVTPTKPGLTLSTSLDTKNNQAETISNNGKCSYPDMNK